MNQPPATGSATSQMSMTLEHHHLDRLSRSDAAVSVADGDDHP
jgi:hypothetical protein